jgi:hypothetical protein
MLRLWPDKFHPNTRLPFWTEKGEGSKGERVRQNCTSIDNSNCQIITQHEDYELICEDTNLGLTRSRELVVIQIFQQGRTEEQKKTIYKHLFESLSRYCGVSGDDLIISCMENTRADWSFGNGEAQFLTGRL